MTDKEIKDMMETLGKAKLQHLLYGWGMTPDEHIKDVYYYHFDKMMDGKPFDLAVNVRRDQWYSTSDFRNGDNCYDLCKLLCNKVGTFNEAHYALFGYELIKKGYARLNDIPWKTEFNNSIVIGRKPIIMKWIQSNRAVFVPGISKQVLYKYAHVGVLPKDGITEEDADVAKAMNLVRRKGHLFYLTDEERKLVKEELRISLAMPTSNGGAYIFNGKHLQLYGDKGITLIGEDNNDPGTKCYVYANVFDFLALMEERHKNSADKWCSEGQHLIVNGLGNLEEAAKYLNKRCDFSEVICVLPHTDYDAETYQIWESVMMATKGTAVSADYLYKDNFSIFDKVGGRVIVKDDKTEKPKKVKKDVKQTIEISSPELPTIKETVKKVVKETPQKIKEVTEKARTRMKR